VDARMVLSYLAGDERRIHGMRNSKIVLRGPHQDCELGYAEDLHVSPRNAAEQPLFRDVRKAFELERLKLVIGKSGIVSFVRARKQKVQASVTDAVDNMRTDGKVPRQTKFGGELEFGRIHVEGWEEKTGPELDNCRVKEIVVTSVFPLGVGTRANSAREEYQLRVANAIRNAFGIKTP